MIDKLKDLHEDLTRRANAARTAAAQYSPKHGTAENIARCAGKSAAYMHAAELVQALINEGEP
jgi:hypothetical protein